jgi:cytochrome c nitrite reductase small subunit
MRAGITLFVSAVLVGACLGVGFYTFIYAKGASYLTNDPQACANCHVMQGQYDAWLKSSHRSVATCNDCHTPHNFIGKYMTKALNGFHHSLAMTSGHFHEPIQIGQRNKEITEAACRHCHADVVDAIDGPHGSAEKMSCIRCHSNVGHALGK